MELHLTPILQALQVSKRYPPNVYALREASITVNTGETLVLIGESGCGKTTLLRLFNRMVDPSAGQVTIKGVEASTLDPIALRRSTGYVQQEGGLLPHWTVKQNLALVPKLLQWKTSRIESRVQDLLTLVGLDASRFGDRYPVELSGGQRQRIAFARGLAADPDVILLDEPFGALDAITRLEVQQEFLRIKNDLHKTMVLVTHDLEEAFRLGDRIAVMKDGAILQVGSAQELRDNPQEGFVKTLLSYGKGGEA